MANDTTYEVFQHYGTEAERLAFVPTPASGIQPIYIWFETDTYETWLYYTTWIQISGTGALGVTVDEYGALDGDGTNLNPLAVRPDNATIIINSNNQLEVIASGGSALPGYNGYRLTLTTATPVTTADVTSSSNIYWTPYKGNIAYLYTGSNWVLYDDGEISLVLSALTSGKNYDVFVDYNGGTPQLVLEAWTDDTTRAVALALQDNVYVRTGATDHLYVGTIRTISTTTTCDFGGGGTTNVGGQRYCWNYYNRVPRWMRVIDTANTWTYSTATWRQANAALPTTGNKVECVVGVVEDALRAAVVANGSPGGVTVGGAVAIGLNSTTTPTGMMANFGNASLQCTYSATLKALPRLGYNAINWLESGNGTATMTWFGDAGAAFVQSGLDGEVLA